MARRSSSLKAEKAADAATGECLGEAQGTRERILVAARALFRELGYSATSLSNIAKRAGVLTGSIHWAFGSKESLFAAVLTKAADDWSLVYAPPPEKARYSLASFHDDLLACIPGFVAEPEFFPLVIVVATEHQAIDSEIRLAAVAIRERWRDVMERGLLADLTDYEPAAAEALARRISRLVLQLLDGAFIFVNLEQTEITIASAFEDVAGIVDRELQQAARMLPRKEDSGPRRADRRG